MKRCLAFVVTGWMIGCSAGTGGSDASGGSDAGGANQGGANQGGGNQGGNGTGGTTQSFSTGGGGAGEEGGGPPINPCGTECGPTELCDGINKGLDDDCDGEVDEGCPCKAGQASSCFMGDPSYLEAEGCNPGSMSCTELGTWGPCTGGNHATEDCFSSDPLGCHPINVVPFATADLSSGAGNFDDNADTHQYTVACPSGVDPCPVPNGTDYTPLQSGEYTVTYTKTVNGVEDTCTFPLYVGARGLRVELSWNFADDNVFQAIDLDLHLHKPMDTQPWATSGAEQDCGFANCKYYNFEPPQDSTSPNWFPPGNAPPDPVNWYLDPVFDQNSCYFAPRGEGQGWIDVGLGCHSPRLDLDNISCDPNETDPTSYAFCAPENINVDYPPNNEWTRVGVHYYQGTSNWTGPVTPTVKVFCDGALAAELGAQGFNVPVVLNGPTDENKMWIAADVLFREDECVKECLVEPVKQIGSDAPVIFNSAQYTSQVGPAYPPVPQ